MDPYAPCPCGSGKKVKFCCQKLLPEMEKIERLQDNQPELALQHLDRLEQTNPGNPWVVTTRAGTLMQQGRFADAKLALLKFLKEHPDHPRANALYAFASFHADGFPACKKAVHRAFKRCIAESPRIVGALLEALGEHHYMQGSLLAARAHLILAMRLSTTEEDRERVIRSVMRFDADPAIPFPLRGGHHIPDYEPSAANREAFDKARHLSLLACWEEAADLLEQFVEQDPNSASLQHMLGLFRAYDGDEESAAEALHAAARLYTPTNLPAAVECETLAQFLDRAHSDRVVPIRMQRYRVSSVSQLLTRLDEATRFVRSEEAPESPYSSVEPAATYLLLDRPLPSQSELKSLTVEQTPLYVGRVLVFDAVPDDELPAMAFVTALEGAALQEIEAEFNSVAASLVEPAATDAPAAGPAVATSEADAELNVIGEIFTEELPLHRNYFLPPGTPGDVRASIIDEHWRVILNEVWPSTPQTALGNRTPADAAQDPEAKVPLQAAVHVLEAFSDERHQLMPVQEVREKLNLQPLPPPELDAEARITMLSGFDLLRLNVSGLSDLQLDELLQRLRISMQTRLYYEALQEWYRRDVPPRDGEPWTVSREAAAHQLSELAAQARRPEEALQWLQAANAAAPDSDEHAFERQLMIRIRELRIRSVFSAPDDLRPLLLDLWENFGSKLPNLRMQLTQMVSQLGIEPPWESAIVTAGGGWSPSAAPTASDSSRKLWLPGQD